MKAMKTMLFAAVAAVTAGAGVVEFTECPKCRPVGTVPKKPKCLSLES